MPKMVKGPSGLRGLEVRLGQVKQLGQVRLGFWHKNNNDLFFDIYSYFDVNIFGAKTPSP